MSDAEDFSFDKAIVQLLPKLRIAALALTRNRHAADDLVQSTVLKALVGKESFLPGSNFAAWMHAILRNHFFSDIRKKRDTTNIDDLPDSRLSVPARQMDSLITMEVTIAISLLPLPFQKAIHAVLAHEGENAYATMALESGEPIGTMKSRVFRARKALASILNGERPELILKALMEEQSEAANPEHIEAGHLTLPSKPPTPVVALAGPSPE